MKRVRHQPIPSAKASGFGRIKRFFTIPVLALIISIISICLTSPLIIDHFMSPKVEYAVVKKLDKEHLFEAYTLTNTGRKTATNVEIVFMMHRKFRITGGEHLGLKKQIMPLTEGLESYDFVLSRLSIDKILPKEQVKFFINGDTKGLWIRGRSDEGKENSLLFGPFIMSCRYDQGLCSFNPAQSTPADK